MRIFGMFCNVPDAIRNQFLALFLCLAFSMLFVTEKSESQEQLSHQPPNLVVTVQQGLVSINAINASRKETVERLAYALGVQVDVMLSGDEEPVNVVLDNASWLDAVKQVSNNYAYQTSADGKLTKLIFYPEGESGTQIAVEANPVNNEIGDGKSSSQPFVFQFDPAKLSEE